MVILVNYEGRYLTKQLLIEFNAAAMREKRNNWIDNDYLKSLPEGYYPILFAMYHSRDEIRTKVIFDIKGTSAYLDMSIKRFDTIPQGIHSEEYGYLVLIESEIRKQMPYGGKEWIEKVQRKPYRKSTFRRKAIPAYDNQCAVCGISNVKLLRAAHIKDAANGGTEEIENGICLCANHEIAYDRGDLKISPDGKIICVVEDTTIKATHINYPKDKSNWPSKKLLKWKYIKT